MFFLSDLPSQVAMTASHHDQSFKAGDAQLERYLELRVCFGGTANLYTSAKTFWDGKDPQNSVIYILYTLCM